MVRRGKEDFLIFCSFGFLNLFRKSKPVSRYICMEIHERGEMLKGWAALTAKKEKKVGV
jgi:hypothetical protein